MSIANSEVERARGTAKHNQPPEREVHPVTRIIFDKTMAIFADAMDLHPDLATAKRSPELIRLVRMLGFWSLLGGDEVETEYRMLLEDIEELSGYERTQIADDRDHINRWAERNYEFKRMTERFASLGQLVAGITMERGDLDYEAMEEFKADADSAIESALDRALKKMRAAEVGHKPQPSARALESAKLVADANAKRKSDYEAQLLRIKARTKEESQRRRSRKEQNAQARAAARPN